MSTKPPKKGWQRVKQIAVRWTTEDGEQAMRRETLWLDPTGHASFLIPIPEYVCKALGVEADLSRSAKAEDVKDKVDGVMRRYHEWYKNAQATPVIIVYAKYFGQTPDGDKLRKESFFIDSEMSHDRSDHTVAIGLQYWLAFKVNGHIHTREEQHKVGPDNEWVRDDDGNYVYEYVVGWRQRDIDGIPLDYTPELHARIDSICKAINSAVVNIHAILESKDVAKALLSLQPGAPLLPAPKP